MTTQQNTTNRQVLNELRELRNGQRVIYWILGVLITFLLFVSIFVLTLLFNVWGDVGELQGLHRNVENTHATIIQ